LTARVKIVGVFAAYAAVLLLAAVGVDRVIAGRLFAEPARYVPTYRSYYHPSVGRKLEQVDALDHLQTLIIGNSITMLAVDPAAMEREMAARGRQFDAYNLAIPSMTVAFWPRFLNEDYQGPQPRQLLLGVQPRDLNARGLALTAPIVRQYYSSEGEHNSDLSGVNAFAEERMSGLFRLWGRRGAFFPALASLRDGRRYDAEDIRVIGKDGFSVTSPWSRPTRAQMVEGKRRYGNRPGTTDFTIDPRARASLVALRDWIAARGGTLTLFTVPIYYDSEDEGTRRIQREFPVAMRRFVSSQKGMRFMDLGNELKSQYGMGDFVDENHLNERAAERFSRTLADRIAGDGN
jgi:hypothetical protein